MSWIDRGQWHGERGEQLVLLLARSYPGRSALVRFVDDSGTGRENLPSDRDDMVFQWHNLLITAHRIGKLRALINTIASDKEALRAQLEQLTSDDPAQNVGNPQDSYQVRLIGPGRRPMINRMDLRAYVRQLFGTERVVLTVRGPRKSGKSHSYLLMSHVARGRENYDLLWFNFAPPSTGDTAKDLLAMICSRLGIEDVTSRPRWTTATTFAGEMMDDFVGLYKDKFREITTTRILVIDGLERFELGSDVYSLAARLALEVAQDQLPNTQLVLIGYTGRFDPVIDYAVIPEDIKEITTTDLRFYFAGLATELGCELTPARLEELSQAAMRGEPGVAALSDRVKQQVLDLIAST